jgi:ADP-heptose:LPS heptosyltransferase
LSLPLALGTRLDTVPARVPYLLPSPEKQLRWKNQLGPGRRKRIGIAWSGSRSHKRDALRSLRFQHLERLLAIDVEWHVVQKGIQADERHQLERWPDVHVHEEALLDFEDTAAIINMMDLVISVDTAPAHLAGAIGKPVWILLPYVADFRWLRNRSDSPWYPSARLFRQREQGRWDSVIDEVVEAFSRHAVD